MKYQGKRFQTLTRCICWGVGNEGEDKYKTIRRIFSVKKEARSDSVLREWEKVRKQNRISNGGVYEELLRTCKIDKKTKH